MGGGGDDPIYETEADRKAIGIAVDQYNKSKDLEYLKDYQEQSVADRRTEGAESFVKGKANLGVQKEFGMALEDANNNLNQAGIDPSSGRATGMNTEAHTTMGEAGSKAQFNAAYENESQGLAGAQNIINTSMGKSGEAMRGLNDVANMSVDDAINDSFSEFNKHSANTQAVGMAAGVAASGAQYAYEKGDS